MKMYFYLLIFCLSIMESFGQQGTVELSYFIFPEFTQGVVLMKNGEKINVLLNYSSLSEEMIFENQGKREAIGNVGAVDTVFIKENKFITLNNKFVEILYHSKFDLYGEHKCRVEEPGKPSGYGGTSKTEAITSYSSVYNGGNFYNLKLPDGYKTIPYAYYWLKKNGECKRFLNMKQLMKLYYDKKDLFKAYCKNHDVKYEDQESIVQLISYLEEEPGNI
jgi:hypothetical protein